MRCWRFLPRMQAGQLDLPKSAEAPNLERSRAGGQRGPGTHEHTTTFLRGFAEGLRARVRQGLRER